MARIARGLSLATICLVMSLAAHAAAGGDVHVSPGLLLGGAALSVICVAAADTRRTFGGILSVVAVSQVALHLFAGASGHQVETPAYGWTPQMIVFHAVAGLVVSALLAWGERLLWALFDLARPWRRPGVAGPVRVAEAPTVRRVFTPGWRVCREPFVDAPATRGPPSPA